MVGLFFYFYTTRTFLSTLVGLQLDLAYIIIVNVLKFLIFVPFRTKEKETFNYKGLFSVNSVIFRSFFVMTGEFGHVTFMTINFTFTEQRGLTTNKNIYILPLFGIELVLKGNSFFFSFYCVSKYHIITLF